MPRSTGNARPPDDPARSASDHPVVPPDAGAEADDNLTLLGDVDRTIVPRAGGGRPQSADTADDATSFAPASDVTRFEPAGDATRYEPADDVTSYQPAAPRASRPSTQRGLASPPSSASTDHSHGTGGRRADSDDQGPLVVGQAFGPRYTITRVLGVGGMGAVYQAWDAELGVDVAVKVIRPEIAADPAAASEIERRFKRELLLARQVTHPNIIRIHDLGDIDGIKYITMPFIDGSDLATILKQEKKIGVPRALLIARGTVSGLVSAHQAGVIHRDLKPANIMIGFDDTPTIMDFGIARSAGGPGQASPPSLKPIRAADLSRTAAAAASSTVAGAIVGTVAYMAPEQARGEEVDQRADIYAFGLIMYDMIIGGRRSERAPSAVAELQQRMQTAPPPPRSIDPSIPEAVDAIVRRCLEPDAGKRFQTTVELQHALDRLDEQGKPLPIMKRVSRRTMIAAAAVVLLLLGASFYTASWLFAPPKEYAPVSVLIADFQNNTNDATFDLTLGQTFTRALESASFITAFDRTRIRQTFRMQPPENFDVVAARQLAIKEGLGVVLAGSITPQGNRYEIAVQAIEPLTGDVTGTFSRTASSRDQILDAVARVVTSVRQALGDETSASAQQLAMKNISTTSLEVASEYAAAVEAQTSGNNEQARQHYERTVQLDPTFGLGYQGLAAVSRNLGRLEDSNKYAEQALGYLDQMTDREKFTARGYYYLRTGDYQQCVKEYGDLLTRYPADITARNQRASCLARLGQTNEAIEELRKLLQILPNHDNYRTNLASLLLSAGDFSGAEQEVRALQARDARAMALLAWSQVGQGLFTEAAESYQQVSTMSPWGASMAAAGLGDIAVHTGRFSEAVRLFEEGAAAELAAGNHDRAAHRLVAAAYAHVSRGQSRAAGTAAERALQTSNVAPVRFLAARIFVEIGNLARAQALADDFSSQIAAEHQAYGKVIEGGIALKKGNAREAIRILTDANAIHDSWLGHFDLGRAFFEARALPQADSEFDRCLQRRAEALSVVDDYPSSGYLPTVYYYQGRVREELKTAGFAEAYREYLKLRGDSTEDPLVPEIRKRIAN